MSSNASSVVTCHSRRCLRAEQTCTLSIEDAENMLFYSLEQLDGTCSQFANANEGKFILRAGDNCNFMCAEGYYAVNGNAIPFICDANPDKTNISGVINKGVMLTSCRSE